MKKVRRIESAFELARILLALVIAYALSLLCLVLVTEDPIEAVYMFAVGPLTSTRGSGRSLSNLFLMPCAGWACVLCMPATVSACLARGLI